MPETDQSRATYFAVRPGSGVVEALDLALPQFERWVDQVHVHENLDAPGVFAALANRSLSDKIDDLFLDGYPMDDDVYDRFIWPYIQQLDDLHHQMTRGTATWAAAEWMTATGFLDDEPDLLPDPTCEPDPTWQVRIDALFATIVQGMGVYVQAWADEATAPAHLPA
jgi:hypothetical protein